MTDTYPSFKCSSLLFMQMFIKTGCVLGTGLGAGDAGGDKKLKIPGLGRPV